MPLINDVTIFVSLYILGGRRAYMHVVPTHKMEVAFLLHSFRRSSVVVVRHWNSVLLVSRGQQRQLHRRLAERELNGIAVTNFPSMIAENFREFIDKLHYKGGFEGDGLLLLAVLFKFVLHIFT